MDIQIHFNVSAESQPMWETLSPSLLLFFKELIVHLGIEGDGTIEFWIADDALYGTTINLIDPKEGYTEEGGLVGVGKSITRVNVDGSFSGYVIIREWVAHRALVGTFGPEFSSDLQTSLTGESCRYYIAHELGHCKDAIERKHELVSPEFSDQRFWIEVVCEYNISILASEFSACVHSASEMSADVFNTEYKNTATYIDGQLNELNVYCTPEIGHEKHAA